MTGGVSITGGLGTFERVLDQGRQQQCCGEWLGALQPPRHRIEQPDWVAVDFYLPIDDELSAWRCAGHWWKKCSAVAKSGNLSAYSIARSSASTETVQNLGGEQSR
jgi:hypothetical protein